MVSIHTGRRSAAFCPTRPRQKMALLLRWRSFWNVPNLSQKTWNGCCHCHTTSSGVRWVFAGAQMMWLVRLSNHRPLVRDFLQVVFDESLQRCLDSYLRHAPRSLDLATLPASPVVANMQRSIHKTVFLTFLRMATHRETKVEKDSIPKKWSCHGKKKNSTYCLFVFPRKTFLHLPCLEKLFMIISCLTFLKFWTSACFLEKATVSCCTRWSVRCLKAKTNSCTIRMVLCDWTKASSLIDWRPWSHKVALRFRPGNRLGDQPNVTSVWDINSQLLAFLYFCALSSKLFIAYWTLAIFSFREHIYSAAVLLQWPWRDGAYCVAGNILLYEI